MSESVRTAERSAEALLTEATDAFVACLDRGEQPDVEEFARRYPAVAEALRHVLPALQLLRGPDLAAGGDGAAEGGSEPARGCLGDFRLVREVGRGGMGVVYEAEQLSLRRRVALKVLPLAGGLDPRQLQRFQHEAQAAAHLHHPHIVPLHAVGSERGVYYYAMQFIDGHTLADLIRALRRRAGLDVSVEGRSTPAAAAGPEPGAATQEAQAGSLTAHSSILDPRSSTLDPRLSSAAWRGGACRRPRRWTTPMNRA
jgi:hypothetical protein